VTLPEEKKALDCKWTFKKKVNENGTVKRYKARLVAKGYNQKYGQDYDETFAPVVKYTTIRAFLAAAAYKNMIVKHIDIKTAFLHGELQEEIFMKQPENIINEGNEEKVCKLNKSIYGLKQAAKTWNDKIADILLKENFSQSTADNCLFTKQDQGKYVFIILYVDDLLIACED
ncbi:retrotransposon ty1-copia subclass, partial [Lasius niger]